MPFWPFKRKPKISPEVRRVQRELESRKTLYHRLQQALPTHERQVKETKQILQRAMLANDRKAIDRASDVLREYEQSLEGTKKRLAVLEKEFGQQ